MNISILYFGRINALTGVSTVMQCLNDGFSSSKVHSLNFYTQDANGRIVAAKKSGSQIESLRMKLVRYIHCSLNFFAQKNAFAGKAYAWLLYDRNAIKIVRAKGDKLRDADALFFHDLFTPYYFRASYPDLWYSKPRVIVLHANGELNKMLFDRIPSLLKNKSHRFYKQMAERVVSDADAIVFLSNEAANRFLVDFSQFENKTHVIPNGMPAILQNNCLPKISSSDTLKIVTVGTVCKRKGHDIIVDALMNLSEDILQKLEFFVVGDGPLLSDLKERCIKNNLNNIHFVGASTDVDGYLAGADVFLLASRDEGLPMAIIEALRWALPIVATKVGGIPTLLSNNNGWLIEPKAGNLAEVLETIIYEKPDLEEMGKRSLDLFLSHFESERMIEAYTRVFENLTKNNY